MRVDNEVTCTSCAKRFEIPSHQTMVFLDQYEGLPKDVEEDEEEP